MSTDTITRPRPVAITIPDAFGGVGVDLCIVPNGRSAPHLDGTRPVTYITAAKARALMEMLADAAHIADPTWLDQAIAAFEATRGVA